MARGVRAGLRDGRSGRTMCPEWITSGATVWGSLAVDVILISTEKRLARILLTLAHFGRECRAETILPSIH